MEWTVTGRLSAGLVIYDMTDLYNLTPELPYGKRVLGKAEKKRAASWEVTARSLDRTAVSWTRVGAVGGDLEELADALGGEMNKKQRLTMVPSITGSSNSESCVLR